MDIAPAGQVHFKPARKYYKQAGQSGLHRQAGAQGDS